MCRGFGIGPTLKGVPMSSAIRFQLPCAGFIAYLKGFKSIVMFVGHVSRY